jgi:hypothetical protein
MNPEFSILHATRGRPEKALNALARWMTTARDPSAVEYIVAVDDDDKVSHFNFEKMDKIWPTMRLVVNTGQGSVSAWNEAAKESTGEILIQAQDDVEPPAHWDLWIREKRLLVKDQPFVVAVSDGFRKDSLLITAICNRMRYEQQGHFLYRGYFSVFSDDEFTIRAYADERDGLCKVINARNLTFLHRHHYHDKSVPYDETYRRENSPEAYAIGQKVFMERNKHLVDLGFKTW